MDQDIAVKTMMLSVKWEDQIPEEYLALVNKYLSLMWVVGFDSGRKWVYARYSKKKTAVIQRDSSGSRIAEFESIAMAERSTKEGHDAIFHALKTHKKTQKGYYWDRVTVK
jgi:hypothetical protein